MMWRWGMSFLVPQVVAQLPSAVTPGLRVVLHHGRMLLEAPRANYSYGALQQVWREVLAEVPLILSSQTPRVLSVGLGAGGVLRLLRQRYPTAALEAIELDPVVVAAARQWFGLDRLGVQVHTGDALTTLQQLDARYDLIVCDVFVDDVVPDSAEGHAYFHALAQRLAPGGTVLLNRIIDTAQQRSRTQAARARFAEHFTLVSTYRTLANEVWVGRRAESA